MILKETRAVVIGRYTTLDRNESVKNNFTLLPYEADDSLSPYWAENGYTEVGTAEVEITLFPEKSITANAVTALRKQRTRELADSQARVNRIDEAIQNLLAITNEN